MIATAFAVAFGLFIAIRGHLKAKRAYDRGFEDGMLGERSRIKAAQGGRLYPDAHDYEDVT